ncbi:sigma-70 family RNA polymerase sigma factor [Actinocorallia sp. B10E7]|uniref:RNA polymerase sigma factor n=1 Tax=Actinocorallia sp. B10E7 TaxID=3153558 RepID=UPI00325D2EDF
MNGARFEELYAAHSHRILGFFLRRVEPGEDAADLVTEVFTIAWRRIATVPEGEEAKLWLYGVARKVLANHRRGSVRRHRLAERLREHLAASQGDDGGSHVRQALARLPQKDREVLALSVWEGLSAPEIAHLLGLRPEAVRSRLARARARLRDELSPQPAG